MNKAEHNFRLLQEIEENRRFLLQIYVQNPELLKTADARIRPLLAPLPIGKYAAATKQRGISLIELIMFIVIVSVAVAGILLVLNVTEKGSADPLIRKQALAAAQSLLEEVELQDFIPATGAVLVGTVTQGNRASAYHIVNEYNTFATTGIYTVDGTVPIVGLEKYNASVTVTNEALNGIAAGSAVRITVTVTDPQGNQIAIDGYRTAY